MYVKQILFVLLSAWLVSGQRPSFAGTKPIGFPELTEKLPSNDLGNRFGEELKIPLEANGDRDLVERISKLPIDQQPFWYINWKALEDRRKNPQTYEQNPNSFLPDSNSGNTVGNNANTGSIPDAGLTSKFGDSSNNGFYQNTNNNYRTNRNYGYY